MWYWPDGGLLGVGRAMGTKGDGLGRASRGGGPCWAGLRGVLLSRAGSGKMGREVDGGRDPAVEWARDADSHGARGGAAAVVGAAGESGCCAAAGLRVACAGDVWVGVVRAGVRGGALATRDAGGVAVGVPGAGCSTRWRMGERGRGSCVVRWDGVRRAISAEMERMSCSMPWMRRRRDSS